MIGETDPDKAETSAALVKQFGSYGPITHGQRIYSDAKAEADTVIAGLIVALSTTGKPELDYPNVSAMRRVA